MDEKTPATFPDPFVPPNNPMGRLAARFGRTEGEAYSLLIGALALVSVSVNALPSVAWDGVVDAATPFAAAGAPVGPPVSSPLTAPAPAGPAVPAPLPPLLATLGPELFVDTTSDFGAAPPSAAPSSQRVDEPASAAPPAVSQTGLRVIAGGYASSEAGTPFATLGVPSGSVAVSRRVGSDDKITFLRLVGVGGLLELPVDPNGANVLAGSASISACPVTQRDWRVGHGDVALDDAPTYDCTRAVIGSVTADGSAWRFDLSAVDLWQGQGVALTPGGTAAQSPTFQVVLRLPEALT